MTPLPGQGTPQSRRCGRTRRSGGAGTARRGPGRRAVANKHLNRDRSLTYRYLQVQCSCRRRRGGGGCDSTSVECLFSIPPLPAQRLRRHGPGAGGGSPGSLGLPDIARHVIGCHVTQAAKVPNVCQRRGGQWARHILLVTSWDAIELLKRGFSSRVDDVAGNICQA